MSNTFQYNINGKPYVVEVLDYFPLVQGNYSGPPETCFPDEGGFGEWVLLNPDGSRAKEVEDELSASQVEDLELKLFQVMEAQIREQLAEAKYEERYDQDYMMNNE